MTKKHFQMFANMCKELRKNATHNEEGFAIVRMIDVEAAMVEVFKADNERFDESRFAKAIGVWN